MRRAVSNREKDIPFLEEVKMLSSLVGAVESMAK
jgi:hypothetical protein